MTHFSYIESKMKMTHFSYIESKMNNNHPKLDGSGHPFLEGYFRV